LHSEGTRTPNRIEPIGLLVEPIRAVFDKIEKHPANVYEHAAIWTTSGSCQLYTVDAAVDPVTGIDVRTGVTVNGHSPTADGTVVQFGDGESIAVETVVVSVGRRPLSENLDLAGTAVTISDRGHVEVDANCRTAEPGVYAIGDLIATPALAHIGFAEGILIIKDILGEDPDPIDYGKVPWCIYCHPEVSFVGHTESSAKEAGFDVIVSKHRYSGNGRALILGESEGMVKIIAEKRPDGTGGRLLGVHMVGPWVTEQLGQAYLAVNWEANADEVAQFIPPHPTRSELFGESVLALTGRSLH
jgi:dihydrolipoamide dehydrogenase